MSDATWIFLLPGFTDRVFGPTTTTRHVYDVAAQHVIASAMEGINGIESDCSSF